MWQRGAALRWDSKAHLQAGLAFLIPTTAMPPEVGAAADRKTSSSHLPQPGPAMLINGSSEVSESPSHPVVTAQPRGDPAAETSIRCA